VKHCQFVLLSAQDKPVIKSIVYFPRIRGGEDSRQRHQKKDAGVCTHLPWDFGKFRENSKDIQANSCTPRLFGPISKLIQQLAVFSVLPFE